MTKYLSIIFMLLLCSCAKANTIQSIDVNGVTKLFLTTTQPTPVTPPVNPPNAMYIGIPAVFEIGDANAISVTYRMYDSNAVQQLARADTPALVYKTSDSGGYYTHYIDSTTGSDSGNTYGTEASPRATIPNSLPAGSVVEVNNTAAWYSSNTRLNGTEALPIFIRGVSTPTITNNGNVYGTYGIVEGLYCYMKRINVASVGDIMCEYIVIRNCEIEGNGTYDNTGTGIAISGSSTYQMLNHHIVIYNNHIHYLGQWDATSENDMHGVKPDKYCQYIWILDNELDHLGGDSVQIGNVGDGKISYVYIGNNICHDNYEDGIDIKCCTDVIVSQNKIYGMYRGGGIFGHYSPDNLWFLFNYIHDNYTGLSGSSIGNYGFIGNIIADIERINVGSVLSSGQPSYVIGNIVYNVPYGIDLPVKTGYPAICCNNIVMKTKNPVDGENYHLDVYNTEANNSIANNNLFFQPDGTVRIRWISTYATIAAWQSATGKGTGTVEADPLFTDPANGNFALQAGSPILGITLDDTARTALNSFFTLYNIDITQYVEDFFNSGVIYAPDEN